MKPHQYRKSSIKASFLLIALAAALAVWLAGCSPKSGCPATHGKSGYSYIKCMATDSICVFNKESKLICIYKEKI